MQNNDASCIGSPNNSQELREDAPLICFGSGDKADVSDCIICPMCGGETDVHNHKVAVHMR